MPVKPRSPETGNFTRTFLLLFCVAAAWVPALLFTYALLTQHMSTREFYMILAALPLFIGLAVFTSYKFTQTAREVFAQADHEGSRDPLEALRQDKRTGRGRHGKWKALSDKHRQK